MSIKGTLAAGAVAALTVVGLGAAPALASTQGLNYEVDNGVSWTLAHGPSALARPVQAGYADAGVVADIGQAANFAGITVTGSANLEDNIWISSGGDEAVRPGTHPLSSPVNFSYGFDNHNGTFWMASGPYEGQTLSDTQIAADFPNAEVYAWAGVVYTGTPVTGYVSSINGIATSHRNVSIAPSDGGALIAAVR